jgi:hypothetical protein
MARSIMNKKKKKTKKYKKKYALLNGIDYISAVEAIWKIKGVAE